MPLYGNQWARDYWQETTMVTVEGLLRLRLQADEISPPTSLQQYNIAQMVTVQFSVEFNGAKRKSES